MRRDAEMMLAAQKCVSAHLSGDEFAKDKYKIWSRSTASLVRNSGLALAVSFLLSKSTEGTDKDGFKWLLEDALRVMGKESDVDRLAETYAEMQPQEYMVETERFLRALAFIKRFAEALIEVKVENANEEERPSEEQNNASSEL
jgi:CRISPR type III-B/RAMP module-associated protein Cmr5